MGIIQKQTVTGTIYSYLGVGIGFLTTGILFPRILSTEEIGLLKLLVSYSLIFSQVGSLGFSNVINRLFPYFRDKKSGHNGFLVLALLVTAAGFALVMITLQILSPVIIRNNISGSPLFVDYFRYLAPLIFFTLFFTLFDTYLKATYDAVIGTVMKEVVQRLIILLFIGLYFFDLIDIQGFIISYVVALSLPAVLIFVSLLKRGEFILVKPRIAGPVRKEIVILCLYGIITGLGTTMILEFNSILINKYLGLSETGIYATAFFFGTLIIIPSRPLIKIASTILADSWMSNDHENIKTVYKKSCIIQGLVSILIFILLWVNINNVFHILPKEFESGKWVIFIIGIANVIEMSTGINMMIIQTSGSYKVNTYITFIFLFVLITSNIILIKIAGITGAALGTLISYIVSNLLRFAFLKIRYKLQPFDYRMILLPMTGALGYLAGWIIPEFNNFIIDILVRSTVTGAVFMIIVLKLQVSEDINNQVNSIIGRKVF